LSLDRVKGSATSTLVFDNFDSTLGNPSQQPLPRLTLQPLPSLGKNMIPQMTQPAADIAAAHPNPYLDVPSWWSYFFGGGFSWRWFSSPHLYFPSNLEYVPSAKPFTVIDGLGREKTYDKPFECYIDPFTGKIRRLYVQGPASLCHLSVKNPNATWRRTPIRNATSVLLRIANLPYRLIPLERRGEVHKFTAGDWLVLALMWIPSVALFLLAASTPIC
jgi:hypothetical protein